LTALCILRPSRRPRRPSKRPRGPSRTPKRPNRTSNDRFSRMGHDISGVPAPHVAECQAYPRMQVHPGGQVYPRLSNVSGLSGIFEPPSVSRPPGISGQLKYTWAASYLWAVRCKLPPSKISGLSPKMTSVTRCWGSDGAATREHVALSSSCCRGQPEDQSTV
jgi:hypothetical protein